MHSKTLGSRVENDGLLQFGQPHNTGGLDEKGPQKNKLPSYIEIAPNNTKTFAINRPKIRDQELSERARVCVVSGVKRKRRTQNQFSDSECNSRKVAVNLTAHALCVCECILSKLVMLRNVIMCNYLQGVVAFK